MNKIKAEFHIHTTYSKDSILNKYFLFLICKLKKISCIAITDHNEVAGALKYKDFFEKHSIKVIVGEEIFTEDGEIIGLYLTEKILPNLSVEETIQEIRKQNGLVYIPHPYDEKRYKTVLKLEKLEKIVEQVDFIECHNGRNVKESYSERQNELAEKYNLRKIIGSDAHTFYEVGRNYCLVNSINRENIKNEIEHSTFHKSRCVKLAHQNTKVARIIKIIKGGKWNELSGIINKKIKGSR